LQALCSEGVLDYQEFLLDHAFPRDTWIQAAEIQPGNRAVVHHITALIRPRGSDPSLVYWDAMEDQYFAIMGPGNSITRWPSGIAKLIPANCGRGHALSRATRCIFRSQLTVLAAAGRLTIPHVAAFPARCSARESRFLSS
jgi:hypothetical protein